MEESLVTLCDRHVADFARDGLVVAPGLFADAAADIAAWAGEVHGWPEVPGKYMMYFERSLKAPHDRVLCRIENFTPWHEGFAQLVAGPLADCAARLFGEPAVLFKEKINFKLPGGGRFEAHQDIQAGWDAYAPNFITALISIDRATVGNGCLEMAPGQHNRGLIGESWKPLGDGDLDGVDFEFCPTEPGDAVFFDAFAPHRSAPNMTDDARRVLYTTYNRASEGDHRERYHADKRASFPPDIERDPGKKYVFRV